MKKKLLLVILILFSFVTVSNAQLIESFDAVVGDTTYQNNVESGSIMTTSAVTTDIIEGTGALQINATIASLHDWGSYAQLIKRVPVGQPYLDWSVSDTLKLWIKVTKAPTLPASMVFRIHIADRLTDDGPIEEYIYEHATILDTEAGWVQLNVPLHERETDGNIVPNDEGFVLFPHSWGGGTYNNEELDFEKIIGYNISAISTSIAADSLIYIVDKFERSGMKSVPAIIFNGVAVPTDLSVFAWGQSTVSVEEGAGPGGTAPNAIRWVQGDEWANGWTGIGYNVNPTFNLGGSWQQDSVKFKLKCEEGVGALRVQFEGGGGKVGTVFNPIADNQWHEYSLPLREMVKQDAATAPDPFDSTKVNVVGLMAEASAIAGKVVFITDWWTGNPVFDVIAPSAPAGLAVVPGTFVNLFTWSDVEGEESESYSVYYSTEPITDIANAEVVKINIAEGIQLIEHLLKAPVTNQDVTYYYAVTCTDKSGNVSQPASLSTPVTNTAKGIVTVSLNAPSTTFAADGDLSEWSGLTPIKIAPSEGGYVVVNTVVTNDDDLSVLAYVAVDNENLYIAMNINDDIISFNPTLATYLNDAPDIFLGLYNWHGKPHTSYQRGLEPDYHIRFGKDRVSVEGITGGDSLLIPGENYYWDEKLSGYVVEAKISFSELAAPGNDNVFVPVEGYRLPLDFSINDADDTGEREGILTYSQFNEDHSYEHPWRWQYTWIGSLWSPVGVNDGDENLINTYSLSQNYPNPFNPSTQINYTLEKPGLVTLKVYDLLGSLVTTLVNEQQNAGLHTVSFNGSNLTSGLYFYQITSNSFTSTKKMLLIK